jgi:hypothetical protein
MNNIISNNLDSKNRIKKYHILNINSNKPNKLKIPITENGNVISSNYKVEKIYKFIDNIAKFSDFLSNKEGLRIIMENIDINYNSKNNTILLNYGLFYKFIMGIVKLINIERIYDNDVDININNHDLNYINNTNLYININTTLYDENNNINMIITNLTQFDKYINSNSISWNNINSYTCSNNTISSLIKVIQNYSNITHTTILYHTSKIIINNKIQHIYAFLIKLNNTNIYNNTTLYSENYKLTKYNTTNPSNIIDIDIDSNTNTTIDTDTDTDTDTTTTTLSYF